MRNARIALLLSKADLLYQRQLSAASLEELTGLWAEALAGQPDEVIEAGFSAWFASQKYFPKPAEVVEAGRLAVAEAKRADQASQQCMTLAAPAPPQEQRAKFKRNCGLARAVAAGRIDADEAKRRSMLPLTPVETEVEVVEAGWEALTEQSGVFGKRNSQDSRITARG